MFYTERIALDLDKRSNSSQHKRLFITPMLIRASISQELLFSIPQVCIVGGNPLHQTNWTAKYSLPSCEAKTMRLLQIS